MIVLKIKILKKMNYLGIGITSYNLPDTKGLLKNIKNL
jgi:hypothetical protein